MSPSRPAAFDFGENWSEFSAQALTAERVEQARADFGRLLAEIPLTGRTFLDIGFGQGLGLLNAASLGARVHGCDINPKCAAVLRANQRHFSGLSGSPEVTVGSILDDAVLQRLRAAGPPAGFDIVHSWGVLHHTGDMRTAIAHAASLVGPGGCLILALYNRHWSSPGWSAIKWSYVHSPRWLQRLFIAALYPVIYVAKWLVVGKNPKQLERGMDFYYDVVDWVGGYPYEYASRAEVVAEVEALGFTVARQIPARVPTGCNEFVFQRSAGRTAAPSSPAA